MKEPLFTDCKFVGRLDPVDYHKNGVRGDPLYAMHRSSLLEFSTCPAKWIRSVEEESTDALEWGDLMDARVLTPDIFGARYVVSPATYPCKPTKKDPRTEKPWTLQANFCKEWKAEKLEAGLKPIGHDEFLASQTAHERLREKEWFRQIMEGAATQQGITGIYRDKTTGLIVPVKCLIDIVPSSDHPLFGRGLADFKTALSAQTRPWTRACFTHGYDVQAAWNLAMWNGGSTAGGKRDMWFHVIQENEPPFQPARRILGERFIELGEDRLAGALKFYCQCLSEDKWPDYDEMEPETVDGWPVTRPEEWMVTAAAPYLFSKQKAQDPAWMSEEPS